MDGFNPHGALRCSQEALLDVHAGGHSTRKGWRQQQSAKLPGVLWGGPHGPHLPGPVSVKGAMLGGWSLDVQQSPEALGEQFTELSV